MRLLPALVLALFALASGSRALATAQLNVSIVLVEESAGQVKVTLAATAPDGRPVANLSAANVRATLDGAPLTVTGIQATQTSQASIGVVMLVDTSGSMTGEPIVQTRRALGDFLETLGPDDLVSIMSFDSTVKTLAAPSTDKGALAAAVSQLNAFGDSALYDGVIEATNKVKTLETDRKLIVLLSDGENNINSDRRAASIRAARDSGVPIMIIVLGSRIDRPYLNEVTSGTGGRLLEAATPAALRQAYAELAISIRTQHVVTLNVPGAIDRTVAAKLSLRVTAGSDVGTAERDLAPLAGAIPPAFSMTVGGFRPGAKLSAATNVTLGLPEGIKPVTAEFSIDDEPLSKSEGAPFELALNPLQFEPGAHMLKVVVTDERGRKGEAQLPFVAVTPAKPMSIPFLPILALLVLGAMGFGVYQLFRRQRLAPETYVSRVKPWRGLEPDAVLNMNIPEFEKPDEPPAPAVIDEGVRGRVIVMNEVAIRAGSLNGIREFVVGTSPITLGTGHHSDIVLEGDEGTIAAEEARLWVQRNRLVYHKLTTLSAMATEGVTSGWIFLEEGEEMTIGSYRIAFRADVPVRELEPAPEPAAEPTPAPRLPDLWPRIQDDAGHLQPSPE